MGLLQNIKDFFTPPKSGPSVREIVEARIDSYDELRRLGYRPVNYSNNPVFLERDFPPLRHDRMQRISLHFWKSSPIGRRLIEIRKNLIISEGFQFIAKGPSKRKNKKLEIFFKNLWKTNKWEEKIDERIQDLLIYGELLFYCPKINPFNGRMKLAYFHQENVEEILSDPYNMEEIDQVVMKSDFEIAEIVDGVQQSKSQKVFKVIRENDQDELEGEIFYIGINKTSSSTRGISDIIHVCDWLDILQKILISESERVEFSKAFVYKCKVQGGQSNVDQVIERQRRPPAPGSVLVYSDKEEWDIIAPQMTLFDTVGFAKYIMLLILGGMGIPEHWFVEAGENNSKAASGDMDEPIFMWARKAKAKIRQFFELILAYAIQEARKNNGLLSEFSDDDCQFEVISRDPDRGAYEQIGKMLTEMSNSLNNIVASQWIPNEEAGKIMRRTIKSLGLGDTEAPKSDVEVNYNVEFIKAKANYQMYENLIREEGRANLVGRLFYPLFSGQDMGNEANTAELFLKNAFEKELNKVKVTIDAMQKAIAGGMPSAGLPNPEFPGLSLGLELGDMGNAKIGQQMDGSDQDQGPQLSGVAQMPGASSTGNGTKGSSGSDKGNGKDVGAKLSGLTGRKLGPGNNGSKPSAK